MERQACDRQLWDSTEGAIGERQRSGRGATGGQQGSDRGATGERQGSYRGLTASDRASGKRATRKTIEERQKSNREAGLLNSHCVWLRSFACQCTTFLALLASVLPHYSRAMDMSQYSRGMGEAIEDAPTPDDLGVRHGGRSCGTKRVLDQWEPTEFAEMIAEAVPLEFQPEEERKCETLKEADDQVKHTVSELISAWPQAPSTDMLGALYVLALFVQEDFVWNASDDILATRLIDLICGDLFRAHSDGVYEYMHGDWRFIEEIKYHVVRKVQKTLGTAAKVFAFLVSKDIKRDLADVFHLLRDNHAVVGAGCSACRSSFVRKLKSEDSADWLREGGRVLLELTHRYAQKGKGAEIVDSFGEYFQTKRPIPTKKFVNLENVTLQINGDIAGEGRFTAVAKSPSNNCYTGIPISLDYKPAWAQEEEMRLFLCTSFAGNPEGRRMDMAAEALVWYDEPSPQVGLIMTGDGGNAKSAKAILRANVMGTLHHFVSSDVLQVPEEFRKQGKHFARARVATVQENQAGVPWIEDVAKRFLSGEFVACRALFGKSTEMFSWSRCMKYFEWNRTYPSVRGDWRNIQSLRSFWRRLAVIELGAVFTSDGDKVSINGRVFPEKEMSAFLESPEARLIYVRSYLVPFIQKYSADQCRQMLKSPSQEVVLATQRVVAQMANGGLELPAAWLPAADREVLVQGAKNLLLELHAFMDNETEVKLYVLVKRKDNPLPGTITGKRHGKSREQNLRDAVSEYPYLFQIDKATVYKLNIDVLRLESMLDDIGRDKVAGGLEGWGALWDLRRELHEFCEPELETHIMDAMAAEMDAGSLTETINFVKLEEACYGQVGEKFDCARAYLERHRREGDRRSDYSTISVKYVQKYNTPGRRYARGPSAQRLSNSLKKMAFASETNVCASYSQVFETFDIDVVNAFMQFLWNELCSVVGDGVEIEYGVLTAVVTNPEGFREFLANYFGVPTKAIKKQLVAILHCGRPQSDLPLLWALAVEMRKATMTVLEQPKFHYLNKRFTSRRFPQATRLHYALSTIEDKLMQDLKVELAREFPDTATVQVYMFDGVVVRFTSLGNAPRLRALLDDFGKKQGVKLTMELF